MRTGMVAALLASAALALVAAVAGGTRRAYSEPPSIEERLSRIEARLDTIERRLGGAPAAPVATAPKPAAAPAGVPEPDRSFDDMLDAITKQGNWLAPGGKGYASDVDRQKVEAALLRPFAQPVVLEGVIVSNPPKTPQLVRGEWVYDASVVVEDQPRFGRLSPPGEPYRTSLQVVLSEEQARKFGPHGEVPGRPKVRFRAILQNIRLNWDDERGWRWTFYVLEKRALEVSGL